MARVWKAGGEKRQFVKNIIDNAWRLD